MAVIAYKTVFIEIVVEDPCFGVYSVVVCVFILSRFLFSLFYRPAPGPGEPLEPTIAIVMPAFNEEDAVADSIRSLLAVDYPQREARDRGRQRRLHRRHAARDPVASRPGSPRCA